MYRNVKPPTTRLASQTLATRPRMDTFDFSVRLEGKKFLRIGRMPSVTDDKQYCVFIIDEERPDDEIEIVGSVNSMSQALWLFDRELLARNLTPPPR